jgi:hypothetical protein
MITAAGTMKPLPVRPVDGIANQSLAPLPRPIAGRGMRPLPMPTTDAHDLIDAIRNGAYQRMLDRLGVQQPLPVVDPTA